MECCVWGDWLRFSMWSKMSKIMSEDNLPDIFPIPFDAAYRMDVSFSDNASISRSIIYYKLFLLTSL